MLVRDFEIEMYPSDDAYEYVLTMRPYVQTSSDVEVWFNANDPETAADTVPDLIDSVEIHHGLKGMPVKLSRRTRIELTTWSPFKPLVKK